MPAPFASFRSLVLRLGVLAAFWAVLLSLSGEVARAQEPARDVGGDRHVADPVLPRGALLFDMEGGTLRVERLFGDPEGELLGTGFFRSGFGADAAPELAPAEERIRALTGAADPPRISLGATRGRFSANEQSLPLRASFGILNRVTIGVTVPVVRRRVDTVLRLSPEGANVGENPDVTQPGEVSAFLSGSRGALEALDAAVEEWCSEMGEGDERCQEGRSLAGSLGSFLDDLSSAYAEEAFFPLQGTGLASLLAERWSAFRAAAQEWDAAPPEGLPVADAPLSDEAFRALVMNPAWGEGGFPVETPRAFLILGDIEAHVAVGLLQPPPEADRTIRIRSALVGTARFGTGPPDSLRAVAPMSPPRGVGGVELKSVSDVLLPGRFAALGIVEVGQPWSRELIVLAPDPERLFSPGGTRAVARWTPGGHVRFSLTPRFHLHPALSLGGGWELLRRGADRYEAVDPEGPSMPEPGRGFRIQRVNLELRYSAMGGVLGETIRFPFEVFLRSSRTVSGSGPWAPDERGIQVGGRVVLRR